MQLDATIRTDSTRSLCCALADELVDEEGAVELDEEALSGLPVTSILWPTCGLSFELSPSNSYVVPRAPDVPVAPVDGVEPVELDDEEPIVAFCRMNPELLELPVVPVVPVAPLGLPARSRHPVTVIWFAARCVDDRVADPVAGLLGGCAWASAMAPAPIAHAVAAINPLHTYLFMLPSSGFADYAAESCNSVASENRSGADAGEQGFGACEKPTSFLDQLVGIARLGEDSVGSSLECAARIVPVPVACNGQDRHIPRPLVRA